MGYSVPAMKQYQKHCTEKQGRLPVYIADFLDTCDPVLTFDQIMEEIEAEAYPIRFPKISQTSSFVPSSLIKTFSQ